MPSPSYTTTVNQSPAYAQRRSSLRLVQNILRGFGQEVRGLLDGRAAEQAGASSPAGLPVQALPGWSFAPGDPLVQWLEQHPAATLLDRLTLDSPLLDELRAEGVQIVAPLLNNGLLVGVLALGPRRSDQQYTSTDRRLLATLADQAAPALHVAHLVEEQRQQAVASERLAQELRMAHEIQLSLLPRTLPEVQGWSVESKYLPARAVGGDFYDFVDLGSNRLGVLIGDVTGKGMPAALIMATTRAVLRSIADTGARPSDVLRRANNQLVRDMAPGYFVTCLYAVINTRTGQTRFANAGHNPPFHRHQGGVAKLDATGLPLGLMADMDYEEGEVTLEEGDCVLFYSDGVTEARAPEHNGRRAMLGFDGLQALLQRFSGAAAPGSCPVVLDGLLGEVQAFTGKQAEQEDDITLLALHRLFMQ